MIAKGKRMSGLYLIALYVLVSGICVLSLALVASRRMPKCGAPKERRDRPAIDTPGQPLIRETLDLPAYLMADRCFLSKSQKCVCRGEIRAIHLAEPVMAGNTDKSLLPNG